jgi:hypothetical protein
MEKISTVNVMVFTSFAGVDIASMTSFPYTEEGIEEAQKLFIELIHKTEDLDDLDEEEQKDEIEVALDDGIYGWNDGGILLVHST